MRPHSRETILKTSLSYTFAALTIAALFVLPMQAMADCTQCVCVTDEECNDTGMCEPHTSDCARIEFTADCSGTYILNSATSCFSSDCAKCQACASVYELTTEGELFIGGCHSTECVVGDCDYHCSLNLVAGQKYVMYVCLGYCPVVADECGDCGNDCKATGCLYFGDQESPCEP